MVGAGGAPAAAAAFAEIVVLLVAAVVMDVVFGLVVGFGAQGLLWKEKRRLVERPLFSSVYVR